METITIGRKKMKTKESTDPIPLHMSAILSHCSPIPKLLIGILFMKLRGGGANK